jgi:heme/copper-type cytochrome/quinol oxidase subunit 3
LTLWNHYFDFAFAFWLITLYAFWISVINWLTDLWIESTVGFTVIEQLGVVIGIKWLILSELMLFYCCFWSVINFRIIVPGFSMFFSFPLLSSYSFAIPFSNLLILLFSSLPIQAAQLFYKVGMLTQVIDGIGQSVCCGLLFILLQCKEFANSYFSLSDCMIGCIFYFTTGLHGIHVIAGCCCWTIISSINLFLSAPGFTELSLSMLICSYYWHFVDIIWLMVYYLYFL